jgi:hypothetical protein
MSFDLSSAYHDGVIREGVPDFLDVLDEELASTFRNFFFFVTDGGVK